MEPTELEAILGVVAPLLAALGAWLRSKKLVSEAQSQIIFAYAEKKLDEALQAHPDDAVLTSGLKCLEKLKEGWYDESVSTEELQTILSIWDGPKYRKLKEL